MSEAHEMTLEQWFRSKWFGYAWKLAALVGGFTFPVLGLIITLVTTDTNATARQANETAVGALNVVSEVKQVQEARADLADQRAVDEKAWRDQISAQGVRRNQRVSAEVGALRDDIGELKGAIGELKGLIIRQTAQGDAGVPAPFPLSGFPAYTP